MPEHEGSGDVVDGLRAVVVHREPDLADFPRRMGHAAVTGVGANQPRLAGLGIAAFVVDPGDLLLPGRAFVLQRLAGGAQSAVGDDRGRDRRGQGEQTDESGREGGPGRQPVGPGGISEHVRTVAAVADEPGRGAPM